MNIEYTEFTSQGLVRQENQDSIFSAVKDEYGLFAVADGMGGHSAGEIASRRIIDALKSWWNSFQAEIYDFDRCYEDLRNVTNEVHESIYKEYTEKGTVCGTTIALIFIYSDRYIIINSGDSRIYSFERMKIRQESKDHVFGIESVISGEMTAEAAEKHPNRNKLTAALGCKKELKTYIATAPLTKEGFFICSDGVYKYCNDTDIRTAFRKKNIVEYISDKVMNNGASDNFSFISIRINGNKKKPPISIQCLAAVICVAVIIAIIAITISLRNKSIAADSESANEIVSLFVPEVPVTVVATDDMLSVSASEMTSETTIADTIESNESEIDLIIEYIRTDDIDSAVIMLIKYADENGIAIDTEKWFENSDDKKAFEDENKVGTTDITKESTETPPTEASDSVTTKSQEDILEVGVTTSLEAGINIPPEETSTSTSAATTEITTSTTPNTKTKDTETESVAVNKDKPEDPYGYLEP